MKRWIVPIACILLVSLLMSSCVEPDAKMSVITPEPRSAQPEGVDATPMPTEQAEPQQTDTASGESVDNQQEDAVNDTDATLDEVVELLDELDAILDEDFED